MKKFWKGLASLAVAAGLLGLAEAAMSKETKSYRAERNADTVLLRGPNGSALLRYVVGKLPAGEKGPAVEGSCYTHPLYTPAGEVVTENGPADHPHHRGVFCAWVKAEGEKAGDWWGWGAFAPKERRLITNQDLTVPPPGRDSATVSAFNAWQAEGETVLDEQVTVTASRRGACNVVDYVYEFSAPTQKPVVLGQNPFGGFCYRARPRGKLEITGPAGAVNHPDSVFNKAETDWPASRWYDLAYRTPEGKVSGVALIDHPSNPKTLWHGVRGIHMLNPCIVAESPVTIRHGTPLTLRYRLVAHDGDAASAPIKKLAEEFAGSR